MDVTLGNTREKLYLGGDAYSAPMVYVRDRNSDWVLYDIVRDYQGSITHLVDDSDGTVVAEYSYDPWGRMRDPETLEIYAPGNEPSLMLGRGYTGHEQHERPAVRPGPGPFPQPRPLRPGTRILPELQPLLLLPQ